MINTRKVTDFESHRTDEEGTLRCPVRLADERSRKLVHETLPFAKASLARAGFQVASTLIAYAGVVGAAYFSPTWAMLPLSLPLSALLIRIFVLEHDCGHRALFPKRQQNDLFGTLFSFVTGTSLKGWSAEHNWHHNFQGHLERRGVDIVNSPMTVAEARANPALAELRAKKISLTAVLLYGAYSLLLRRRRPAGYFPFRKAWKVGVPQRKELIFDIILANAVFASYNLGLAWSLGAWRWALLFPPAYALAAAAGGAIFWVHHNFENSYFAATADWTWADVSLRGCSWLRLPRLIRWITADICLHHVHHLNPRIPNYRLEEARVAIPTLACIPPLSWAQVKRSFTHVFWDEEARVMTAEWREQVSRSGVPSLGELSNGGQTVPPARG